MDFQKFKEPFSETKQNKKIDFSIVTGCYYRKVNFLLLTALREKLFNDVDFRFVTKVSREE